ncbi:hypothetical protein [Citricoccus nitrophenolicus]|uniref:hypothetical protein n=1 Tax=Citricoccus nitrophenolicus TaxID=863575 RepID=UPI0031ECC0D1
MGGAGIPRYPLTPDEYAHGFDDCLNYAPHALRRAQVDGLKSLLDAVQDADDVRDLVTHLISAEAPAV